MLTDSLTPSHGVKYCPRPGRVFLPTSPPPPQEEEPHSETILPAALAARRKRLAATSAAASVIFDSVDSLINNANSTSQMLHPREGKTHFLSIWILFFDKMCQIA